MESLLLLMFGVNDTPHGVQTVRRWLRALAIREHDLANGAPPLVQRLNDAVLAVHSTAIENLTIRKAA